MTARIPFALGVALDGAGTHPGAPGTVPEPEEFVRLVRRAEDALLDFVTVEDAPGRHDSNLLAAVAVSGTSRIGLVPVGTTSGEPSAYATRSATLDLLSGGRAGVRPRLGTSPAERERLLGLIGTPEGDEAIAGLFEEASAFLGEVAREWDDAPEALRPPQGRPPVLSLGHDTSPYRFAVRRADVVLVTPTDAAGLRRIREEIESLSAEEGRAPGTLRVYGDLNVVLAGTEAEARERREALDARAPGYTSDAYTFAGTAEGLADLLADWAREGGADGFRVRPAVLPDDLYALVDGTIPELTRRGLLRTAYETRTLRGHLGLTDGKRNA
ncbi:LLM class flavin-dependent oxidoreductase [Streptomyces sp. SP18CS02]|uniref:LLM class flavin-dependent oxidoreductase n=1 Tax=Streptomyces sp. SP18CS02 TaxID=3002531 RepID=UPI002E7907D8|nr:LLM class flavin-dependent oxidoreductase [Streptomyces sp. SP18CS02]MEE1752540.1 LLM class flavin-dependent oxidoreductase [Streptomyces sp. SP18CS02]